MYKIINIINNNISKKYVIKINFNKSKVIVNEAVIALILLFCSSKPLIAYFHVLAIQL
jgi:hypothetical protein